MKWGMALVSHAAHSEFQIIVTKMNYKRSLKREPTFMRRQVKENHMSCSIQEAWYTIVCMPLFANKAQRIREINFETDNHKLCRNARVSYAFAGQVFGVQLFLYQIPLFSEFTFAFFRLVLFSLSSFSFFYFSSFSNWSTSISNILSTSSPFLTKQLV